MYKSYLKRHQEKCNSKIIVEDSKILNEIPSAAEFKDFIYLLQEREFIKTNESIYKIGKSINPKDRLSSYPKGSKLLVLLNCEDCHISEKELINTFTEKFTLRKDIGNEYFQGDAKEMTREILNYFN